jgi:hypothetical protein
MLDTYIRGLITNPRGFRDSLKRTYLDVAGQLNFNLDKHREPASITHDLSHFDQCMIIRIRVPAETFHVRLSEFDMQEIKDDNDKKISRSKTKVDHIRGSM